MNAGRRCPLLVLLTVYTNLFLTDINVIRFSLEETAQYTAFWDTPLFEDTHKIDNMYYI